MKIGALKEVIAGESRVAMTPDSALQLQKLGHACVIEAGAAYASAAPDLFQRPKVDLTKALPIPAALPTPGMVMR